MWTALVPALPILAVLALFSGVGRVPDITLEVRGDRLLVRLGIWDRLYCLRRGVVLALDDITNVAVTPRELLPTPGFRLPGTALPGVIRAGSFGAGEAREFWDVRRAPDVLAISLRSASPYRRLFLEVADPHGEAHRLRAVVAR
jgi:hypothetical protein